MQIIKEKVSPEYKKIYKLDNGMVIKIPKYKVTAVYLGDKETAKNYGLKVKGTKKLYFTEDGKAVLNGYIAEEKTEKDLVLTGTIKINKNNIDDFFDLITSLLYEE